MLSICILTTVHILYHLPTLSLTRQKKKNGSFWPLPLSSNNESLPQLAKPHATRTRKKSRRILTLVATLVFPVAKRPKFRLSTTMSGTMPTLFERPVAPQQHPSFQSHLIHHHPSPYWTIPSCGRSHFSYWALLALLLGLAYRKHPSQRNILTSIV